LLFLGAASEAEDGSQHMSGKVSVYVPCYNAAEHLAPVIEAVLQQTLSAGEILIIDDGSRDATAEIAARYPVSLIRHEGNRGLAAARNTGFRSARNELVASLDADCIPAPDWLEKLVPRMEDDAIVGAGGRLLETMQHTIADRWRRAHLSQEWGNTPLPNPRFLFGNNNIFRKSAVDRAGGYDETLRTNGEDVDICTRIRRLGYELAYEPAAVVHHLRHDTIWTVLETYWRWWRYGVRAYPNGVRLRSVLGHLYSVHFRTTFFGLVKQDLREKKYELLWMDLLALLYMPYRDLQLYREANAALEPRRALSEG